MKRSIGPRAIAFPTPVFVIGTYDENDVPNVMTAAWTGICCSEPPCISVSLRKATYTYSGLSLHKAFTVNVPSENQVREVDFFGVTSGRKTDKIGDTRFTAVPAEHVHAPYLDQFPLILECQLIHTHVLGLHTLFIGEIVDLKAEESIINDQGVPDVEKMRPLVYAPEIRKYYGLGPCLGNAFSMGKALRKPRLS